MDLNDLLLYLVRGALTAFEVITEQLSQADLKSLRYISHEVSDILVPYVFNNSEEIHISAYGPDLHIAQAILSNPLLRYRVRNLVWDYSVIDYELLRYAWYDGFGNKVSGSEWEDHCLLIYDHANILANGIDADILKQALVSLPNLSSIHVANCNIYKTTTPTSLTFDRRRFTTTSATTAMLNHTYTINLLHYATPCLPSWLNLEEVLAGIRKPQTEPGRSQHLMYRGDCDALSCCYWVNKASPGRVVSLVTAMAQAPGLQLHEFVVSSSKGSECGKEEAWAYAFRTCSPEMLSGWISKFASVKQLSLYMDDGGHVKTQDIDRQYLQRQFQPILEIANSLEDLQITGVGWDVTVMLRTNYPRLRRLFAETANFTFGSLKDFCRRHITSLQVLEVRNSQMNGGSWQQFLFDLVRSPILRANKTSTDAWAAMEDQTLNIRLHKVFESGNLQYQGVHRVFRKSIIRSSRTVALRFQDGGRDLFLRRLHFRPLGPPESQCRIHQDDNAPYTMWSYVAGQWLPFSLIDYK